ncbi:hypothetical protein GCM10020000_76910 [Streptomyces olivoverticillatus]
MTPGDGVTGTVTIPGQCVVRRNQNMSFVILVADPKTGCVELVGHSRPRSRTSVSTPASPNRRAATEPPNPDPMTRARKCVRETALAKLLLPEAPPALPH